MAEQIICKRCNERDIYLQYRGMQVGAYCSNCGGWLKWVGKKDLPYYTSRGLKILAEGQQVTIKRDAPIGVIIEDTKPVKLSTFAKKDDLPFNTDETDSKEFQEWESEYKKRVQSESLKSDGLKSEGTSIAMEVEIEKRVKARLLVEKEGLDAEIERQVTERLKNHVPTEQYKDYCSICDGQPLKPYKDSDNKQVDVTIYDGVLTVTNQDGTSLLGLYVINRCPECGRPYTNVEG